MPGVLNYILGIHLANASMTAFGLRSMTLSSTSAGPRGVRSPLDIVGARWDRIVWRSFIRAPDRGRSTIFIVAVSIIA